MSSFSEAERILFGAISAGESCSFDQEDDVVLRSTVLTSLILLLQSEKTGEKLRITPKGIRVSGARILGAMNLDFVALPYPLFFEQCTFDEGISARNARIRALSLKGCKVRNLDCHEALIESSLDLSDGFVARSVNLAGAEVCGQLNCSNSILLGQDGIAINANELRTHHGVYLNDARCGSGVVSFIKAHIGGSFRCLGGEFSNPDGIALDLSGAEVAGGIFLRRTMLPGKVTSRIQGRLLLRGAKCDVYSDDELIWPEHGQLVLDGFEYARFTDTSTEAAARLRWLLLQIPEHLRGRGFKPQPWEQVCVTLREMGHDQDARRIAIRRRDQQIATGAYGFFESLWNRLLGMLVGHGYQPWFGVWWASFFILLGTVFFNAANIDGLMAPTDSIVLIALENHAPKELPTAYPAFNPFVYSVDVFVPFVVLDQKSRWGPGRLRTPATLVTHWWNPGFCNLLFWIRNCMPNSPVLAELVEIFYWIYSIIGTVVCSLTALAFAGLLKRR